MVVQESIKVRKEDKDKVDKTKSMDGNFYGGERVMTNLYTLRWCSARKESV